MCVYIDTYIYIYREREREIEREREAPAAPAARGRPPAAPAAAAGPEGTVSFHNFKLYARLCYTRTYYNILFRTIPY